MLIIVTSALTYFYFFAKGAAPDAGEAGQPSEAELLAAYAPDIIDLAGDPLRIELPDEAVISSKLRWFLSPAALARYGVQGNIAVLHERILPTGTQIMLKIPSTQRDFAFFEAQKSRRDRPAVKPANTRQTPAISNDAQPQSEDTPADADAAQAPASSATEEDDGDAGDAGDWAGLDGVSTAPVNETWKKGTVEDNVSTEYLIADSSRVPATTDSFLEVVGEAKLADFLVENRVSPVIAKFAGDEVAAQFGVTTLSAGSVVALRFAQQTGSTSVRKRLVQIALYSPGKYIGALAATSDGTFAPSVDPWADKNLSALKHQNDNGQKLEKFRLIDGVYSAAIRNGIPSRVAGEAIMQLSRNYDLAEYANESDWITLVYSKTPREKEGAQTSILYIGIDRADSAIKCYVTLIDQTRGFGCFDENATTEATTANNGMVLPVSGVMTSPFGPRLHPILKKVLLHKGVDWAAPIGTPVRAAYAGVVAFAGDKGTFGNFIRLDHGANRATGYAHLSAFAKGLTTGTKVNAGDVIGYVGTSGRSTGPHLHFEAYFNNTVVDPLQIQVAEVGDDAKIVKQMIDRIIQIESGGRSDAKNPRSTATGLGQFLESTWLRMIRSYRPDLMSSLSRAEVLALRADPTLSREMLGNLTRESEDYLKSRGHKITAGRLYLAHFLGVGGADIVLRTPAETPLSSILSAGVISANPHLKGWNVAKIISWTDGLMSGSRKSAPQPEEEEKPPEKVPVALPLDYTRFRDDMNTILKLAVQSASP